MPVSRGARGRLARLSPAWQPTGLNGDLHESLVALDGRLDKAGEERVWLLRLRAELRMELHGHEPGLFRNFDNLRQILLRIRARDRDAGRLELPAVFGIELGTVAVPLVDRVRAVASGRPRVLVENARPRTEPHRSAFVRHLFLLFEHTDHGMRRMGHEFGAVGSVQLQDVTG